MKPKQHDHSRNDFQIERISFFSDAIYAIAITLLIIEIKAPHISDDLAKGQMVDQLLALVPKFIGFTVSFFVIALYWRSHHMIFGFVTGYSEKLININLLLLFTIVMMPFSSAYYSENINYNIAFYFYWGNIILTGLFNYWMIVYAFNPAHHLVADPPEKKFIGELKIRSLTGLLVFISGIIICPLFPLTSRFWFLLVWPVSFIVVKVYKKSQRSLNG